jgi:curved DNA-binding protein CbpA
VIYHHILGVEKTAGDREVRERYLALVREFPPDRHPEAFQRITRAYEALKDRRSRVRARLTGVNDFTFWTDALDALVDSIPTAPQAPGLDRIIKADNK